MKDKGEARNGDGDSGERICMAREGSARRWSSERATTTYEEHGTGHHQQPCVVSFATMECPIFQQLRVASTADDQREVSESREGRAAGRRGSQEEEVKDKIEADGTPVQKGRGYPPELRETRRRSASWPASSDDVYGLGDLARSTEASAAQATTAPGADWVFHCPSSGHDDDDERHAPVLAQLLNGR